MKHMLLMICLLLLMTLGAAALAESPYEKVDKPLTLFAVNVGKGDALLLNSGAETYLIDAGLQENWGDLSRALKVLQVTRLTGVILTHTDKDHAGGLLPLATSSIEVENWYASAHYADIKKESKHPAVEAAALRGETVTFLRAGDELPLGAGRLTVVGPISASEVENCNSLVLVAEASGGKMLLAGDMEFPEEKELIAAGAIPRATAPRREASVTVGRYGTIESNPASKKRFRSALAEGGMPICRVCSWNPLPCRRTTCGVISAPCKRIARR